MVDKKPKTAKNKVTPKKKTVTKMVDVMDNVNKMEKELNKMAGF